LATICLKCLEKEASRRYGSAEALADDLERWQRWHQSNVQPQAAAPHDRSEPGVSAVRGVECRRVEGGPGQSTVVASATALGYGSRLDSKA